MEKETKVIDIKMAKVVNGINDQISDWQDSYSIEGDFEVVSGSNVLKLPGFNAEGVTVFRVTDVVDEPVDEGDGNFDTDKRNTLIVAVLDFVPTEVMLDEIFNQMAYYNNSMTEDLCQESVVVIPEIKTWHSESVLVDRRMHTFTDQFVSDILESFSLKF